MINLREGEYFGQSLQALETPLFKLSLTSYPAGSTIEDHYHENGYLSMLTTGQYIEKQYGEADLVNASDVLFRPASCCHHNAFQGGAATCFNVEFKEGWDKHLDLSLKLPARHKHYERGASSSFYKLLLHFKLNGEQSVMTELILDWLYTVNETEGVRRPKAWMIEVEKILRNELGYFHSLQSLAERIHVHPVYMARAFKQQKGVTIGEYQLKAKLQHAIYLLTTTERSISSISYANGFYDDAHFIRSFKTIYGIAPSRFRRIVNSQSGTI